MERLLLPAFGCLTALRARRSHVAAGAGRGSGSTGEVRADLSCCRQPGLRLLWGARQKHCKSRVHSTYSPMPGIIRKRSFTFLSTAVVMIFTRGKA